MKVSACNLPTGALLSRYAGTSIYTDCYFVDIAQHVSLSTYISAFYSSAAFRPERRLLGWLLGMKASSADIAMLAEARSTRFAAWTLEDRTADELLLCDYRQATRSWLKVEPLPAGGMRLYFGTAVALSAQQGAYRAAGKVLFRSLLWFHKPYSGLLLRHAARGCGR